MPWHVEQGGGICGNSEWAVIKDDDGSTAGCHPTKDEAEAQMAALYANEGAESMPVMTVPRASAAEDRKTAAEARAAGASQADYYRSKPAEPVNIAAPCGLARSLAFPAQMRAKLIERDGQSLYNLNGVASVTDTPYEMYDAFGPYDEIIAGAAFTETLAASPDVAFLVNHRGVTMARTTNGTLVLALTGDGLQADAWLNPKRQDVKDLVIAIEDRNISEMSFAFMLEEGWWNDDFTIFKITKLSIDRGDVSAVNYGANPYTSIAARSREILADLEGLPLGAAKVALERLQHRQDLAPVRTSPATPSEPAGMAEWNELGAYLERFSD